MMQWCALYSRIVRNRVYNPLKLEKYFNHWIFITFMTNTNKHSFPSCVIPLVMAYIAIMISSELFVNKSINMPWGYTTAATLIFPFWFILNDIFAEVYGYKLALKIIRMGFIIQLIFNVICYYLSNFSSPVYWHHDAEYHFMFNSLIRIELSTFCAFIVSGYVNIRLLTKWKVLMAGKHFWLRSIGSSIIAECIYSICNVMAVFFGLISFSNIPIIIFWSFFLKVIFTILFAYPAVLVVNLIKKIDNIDIYDDGLSFNPFKINLIKENSHAKLN